MRGLKIRSADTLTDWSVGIANLAGAGTVKEALDTKISADGGTFAGTIHVPDNAVDLTAAVNLAQVENLVASFGGTTAQITNKIINPNFTIGQRWGVPLVVTSGTWGPGYRYFDMWKAGSSGCTYSFDPTTHTITISAGTLVQVIDGINLRSGQHTLSWNGTSQGRVDSGLYGASGLIGTAVGGVNQEVEFGVGTLSDVQYEEGTSATLFSPRQYGAELMLCERYYQTGNIWYEASVIAGNYYNHNVQFRTQMRGYPTIYFGTAYQEQSPLGQYTFYQNPSVGYGEYPMTVTSVYGTYSGGNSTAFRVQMYALENSPTAYVEYDYMAASDI
jgi:hypothetical protein